jgi:hypothetical protein
VEYAGYEYCYLRETIFPPKAHSRFKTFVNCCHVATQVLRVLLFTGADRSVWASLGKLHDNDDEDDRKSEVKAAPNVATRFF